MALVPRLVRSVELVVVTVVTKLVVVTITSRKSRFVSGTDRQRENFVDSPPLAVERPPATELC